MSRLTVVLAAAIAGCTNTTDPYLSREVCDESHVDMVMLMMPQADANGGTTMVPQWYPQTTCDRSHVETWKNPDYIARPQP